MNDPAVKIVWGDLTKYADVLELVTGAGYVLHVGGMVSPAADYYPVSTIKTNVTAAEHAVIVAVAAGDAPQHQVHGVVEEAAVLIVDLAALGGGGVGRDTQMKIAAAASGNPPGLQIGCRIFVQIGYLPGWVRVRSSKRSV